MDLNGNVIGGGGGELAGFLNFFCHNNVCEEKKTLPECRKDDNYYFERKGYVYGGYKPDGNYNMSIFDCRDKCELNCLCTAFASITQDGTGCQIWSEVSYIKAKVR